MYNSITMHNSYSKNIEKKMFEPPKNYNEMLPKLHRATFFTTLLFFIFLVSFNYIPLITLPDKYIPPIKDHEESIKWALSFGVLPVVAAFIAWIISGALDLHNNAAKFLKVRYLWDQYLIIKPLARIANITRKLNKEESHKVMSKLYYPEVIELRDKHYIELFWNKVYYFWVFFEHAVIASCALIIITLLKSLNVFQVKSPLSYLLIWVFVSISIVFIIFFASVKQRTDSQVRQISEKKIKDFFKNQKIK